MAFLFGASPAEPDKRAMILFKTNIAGVVPPLGYTIDDPGRLSWTGPSKLTLEDVLSARAGETIAEAVDFLRNALSAGPRPSGEVLEEARANAFSLPTINRAKKVLGINVTAVHASGKKGVHHWNWALP